MAVYPRDLLYVVHLGSLNVVESTGRVYWFQKANTDEVAPDGHIAYMAFLNNLMKGHPISLTGLPIKGAGSRGNLLNVVTNK